MAGHHIKRVAAPRTWPIARKTSKWIAKPSPGPHSLERGMPLVVVLRDLLSVADKSKEIKQVLHEKNVLVDGKIRKDHHFPVGMFDIISIPKTNTHYIVMIDTHGRFKLVPTTNSTTKLLKIVNKLTVKGGKTQLVFHDGTTMLASNDYNTKDSVLIKIPERTIEQHLKFETGSLAMVVEGQHAGQVGTIKEHKVVRSSNSNRVILSTPGGEFETVEKYVFVIGKDKPVIAGVGA